MKRTRTLEESTPILVVDENVSLEEQIARRANELWLQDAVNAGIT
jgi:hypothetical protein